MIELPAILVWVWSAASVANLAIAIAHWRLVRRQRSQGGIRR